MNRIQPEQTNRIKKTHPLLELVQALFIAVAITLVVRTFIFQPFWVPTTSMVPTLMVDDRIIVNELYLRYSDVERGDVMVFRYPLDTDVVYVKRMIGLPGEELEIRADGVYIEGARLDEPWLEKAYEYEPMGPVLIPDGFYFAMGDNRPFSKDSRYWGFVPEENFIGKASIVYWPFSRAGAIE